MIDPGREAAMVPSPVAEQYRQAVRDDSDGEVGPAVAVEVARDQGDGRVPHRVGHRVLERAVAVAQEHRQPSVAGSRRRHGDGEVELAVAVEVARHEAPSGDAPTA